MSRETGIEGRLNFLRIDDVMLRDLALAKPIVAKHIDSILDEFYAYVVTFPNLAQLFEKPEVLQHARDKQKQHWLQNVFAGDFGPSYENSVFAIAKAHERVGLKPEFYIGAYEFVLERLLAVLEAELAPQGGLRGLSHARQKQAKLNAVREAVLKALFLDMGIVIDAYFVEIQRAAGQVMDDLANQFETQIDAILTDVYRSADDLKGVSEIMASAATEGANQASVVAGAASMASESVELVAGAAQELSATTQEIGQQVVLSSSIVREAVEKIEATNQVVNDLTNAVTRISEIVGLIHGIASQTNLLALNATIEAARAGSAGKGFAVVAGEVKALAQQTAHATEEITGQIDAVQSSTQASVEAIQTVGSVISKIDHASTAIASAVEEQGVATQEISRSIHDAANGASEVTENIAGVSEAAKQTGMAADTVLSSAVSLVEQSQCLSKRLQAFVTEMRSHTDVTEVVQVRAKAG